MTQQSNEREIGQSVVASLRAATVDLHRQLHGHPLIVELLTCSSLDCYEAVLEAFLGFYKTVEPEIVECARRFGLGEQYPSPVRTQWLLADLRALGCDWVERHRGNDATVFPELTNVETLLGVLYVVKGSATVP